MRLHNTRAIGLMRLHNKAAEARGSVDLFLVQGVASWLHTYRNGGRTLELPDVEQVMNAILQVTYRARPDLVPSITYDRVKR